MMHHYIVVRSDMPTGVQMAQAVHAAGESSSGDLEPDTHAVCLHAASEAQLHTIHNHLTEAGISSVLVKEPDPPFLGQATAIGIPPGPRERVRRILRDLPLAFKGVP